MRVSGCSVKESYMMQYTFYSKSHVNGDKLAVKTEVKIINMHLQFPLICLFPKQSLFPHSIHTYLG